MLFELDTNVSSDPLLVPISETINYIYCYNEPVVELITDYYWSRWYLVIYSFADTAMTEDD